MNGTAFNKDTGDVYYLREVPVTYLPTPKVAVVKANYGNGEITLIKILSVTDTSIYSRGGIKINENDVNGLISKTFTLAQNGTDVSTTFTSADFGIDNGYVLSADGTIASGTFTYEPYWITRDQIKVYGGADKVKTVTISGDLKTMA